MHWPGHLADAGGIRKQFCHAIDIAPTVLAAIGIAQPAHVACVPQMPVHGTSLLPTFGQSDAPIPRGPQYFEMFGHRALVLDGWKAVSRHQPGTPYEDDVWELYHLDRDFSECTDLAQAEPDRLQRMIALWWQQAETHGVLPLDDRGPSDLFRASQRPGMPTARRRFVYYPPISHVPSDACPSPARGWQTTIELTHPQGAGDGVLINRGTINSGFALYILQGRLHFDYNGFHDHTRAVATEVLTAGPHTLVLDVVRQDDGGAQVTLRIDDAVVAQALVPKLLFVLTSLGMDLGCANAAINNDYQAPFAYPGRMHKVVFELADKVSRGEIKAVMRAEMARQ
jgi:arylsulfatase